MLKLFQKCLFVFFNCGTTAKQMILHRQHSFCVSFFPSSYSLPHLPLHLVSFNRTFVHMWRLMSFLPSIWLCRIKKELKKENVLILHLDAAATCVCEWQWDKNREQKLKQNHTKKLKNSTCKCCARKLERDTAECIICFWINSRLHLIMHLINLWLDKKCKLTVRNKFKVNNPKAGVNIFSIFSFR